MRKLVLALFLSTLIFSSAFAMGGIIGKVAPVEQGMTAGNAPYNGLPAIFQGTTIGANKDYFSQLQVTVGDKIQAIGTEYTNVGPRAIVRLTVSGIGKAAFNPSITQYNQWVNRHGNSNILGSPIILEVDGWKFNPQEFVYMAGQSSVLTRKPSGAYPLWTITMISQMSLDDYNTKFKPAFETWNAANNIFTFDRSFAITNNNYSGQNFYYNSARFGSLAAQLQAYINE